MDQCHSCGSGNPVINKYKQCSLLKLIALKFSSFFPDSRGSGNDIFAIFGSMQQRRSSHGVTPKQYLET
ncbi:MAG: hypothetical protein O7C58_05160 [Rickettsia endosymbiont of Ixodes persulcatus]|nr:hypothetical protein [Rickettsia endosymbiont of Ixodes persulcatus]